MTRTDRAVPKGRLRVVIIGAGFIGNVHRRSALLAGADIVGAMASSPGRSEEVARSWGTAPVRSLADLEGLAPDVVHVCSPNAGHVEQVAAAFGAGAHVVCEKPLALDAAGAESLARMSASSGLLGMVPYVYRFHPLIREIRSRARAGAFGRWRLLHGSYLQDWLALTSSTNWRVDAAAGGPSRTFADIGSHWCDLMEFVTGERIASVMASLTTTVAERPAEIAAPFGGGVAGPTVAVDTEDAAAVMFRTRSGVLGSVVVSQVAPGRKNRLWLEVDGARRSAVFDQENPETVWLGSQDAAEVLVRDPLYGSADQRRLSRLPAGHPQGYSHCFDNFVADAYAAVQGEHRDGLPSFGDGVRSAHLIEAVLTSAGCGRWVDVPSVKADGAAAPVGMEKR